MTALKELRAQHLWTESRRRNLPEAPPGFIYFIGGREDGPIKIGYAKNVRARLGDLQVGNPHPLEVLATLPAKPADERRLLVAMASHRLRGEWFEREAAVALLAAGEMAFRSTIQDEITAIGTQNGRNGFAKTAVSRERTPC